MVPTIDVLATNPSFDTLARPDDETATAVYAVHVFELNLVSVIWLQFNYSHRPAKMCY
jgi:hypothetical protein